MYLHVFALFIECIYLIIIQYNHAKFGSKMYFGILALPFQSEVFHYPLFICNIRKVPYRHVNIISAFFPPDLKFFLNFTCMKIYLLFLLLDFIF